MCAVMWRWASEYAGLAYHIEQYLAGAEELGVGDMHGADNGDGRGNGSWGGLMDGSPDEYDQFDFRTGEWRHQ